MKFGEMNLKGDSPLRSSAALSLFTLTRWQRQEKAESLLVLAKMLDDLCCVTANDLFGATSIRDRQAAQLIGGQAGDFVREWQQKWMILMDFLTSIFPNHSSEAP